MAESHRRSADKAAPVGARTAIKFVVLLGVVSLFADMTYEGARSITGPFLASLGASAAVTGFVSGLGEFIGYGVRVFSGYFADRSRRYWAITIWGYALNLLAVPLLALAGNWPLAAALIIAERFGKAVRTPARDAMLSHATARMGRGWGFGLHEAMDQIGAVLGPLIVATVLYFKGGYSMGFGVLLVPAILSLIVLLWAHRLYPRPQSLEADEEAGAVAESRRFPRVFYLYLGFVAVSVAGYANFQLISYHFQASSLVPQAQIPLLFAVAMGVDALVALVAGRIFDRAGLSVLFAIPLLSLPIAPLAFSASYGAAVAGVVLWGAVIGIQETVMRAAVGGLVSATRRGTAYGLFNGAYGLSWFLGSALMGFLYEANIGYLVAFSVVVQLVSLAPLIFLRRESSVSP